MTNSAKAALAVILLAACGPEKKLPAPQLHWTDGSCGYKEGHISTAITCVKLPGGSEEHTNVSVGLDGMDLLIGGTDLRNGTKLTAGSTTAESVKGEALLRIPVVDKIAKAPIAQLLGDGPVDLGVTFTLSLPHTEDVALQVPPVVLTRFVYERLGGVAKGPVTFGAEGPPASNKHVAVLVDDTPSKPVIHGTGQTLSDLDWVAIRAKRGERRLGACRFRTVDNGPVTDVPLIADDETVTIYDRRTGAAVDKKDFDAVANKGFDAAATCQQPSHNHSDDAKGRHVPADGSAIQAWLEQRVAK